MDTIRTDHPDLPVIVIGDSQNEQILQRFAMEQSLHGYLTRPFEAGDLLAVLDAATASGR
jgi:AmiR/NasT family two-component response regulator